MPPILTRAIALEKVLLCSPARSEIFHMEKACPDALWRGRDFSVRTAIVAHGPAAAPASALSLHGMHILSADGLWQANANTLRLGCCRVSEAGLGCMCSPCPGESQEVQHGHALLQHDAREHRILHLQAHCLVRALSGSSPCSPAMMRQFSRRWWQS